MLARSSTGFGMLALASLLTHEARGEAVVGVPSAIQYPRRAKNVIFCYMSGGVSHLDSFDPKPRLAKEAGN